MNRVGVLIFIFVVFLSLLIGCSPETGLGSMPTKRPQTESAPVLTVTLATIPTEMPQSEPERLQQGTETPEETSNETPTPPPTLEVSETNEESATEMPPMATSETVVLTAPASEIEVPGNRILSMSFAKNGNLVAVAGPEGLALFDADSLMPIDSFNSPAAMDESFCLGFSPDESLVASSPSNILVMNSTTGELLYELEGPSDGKCFLWIPNTNRIINPRGNSLNEFEQGSLRHEYKSTLISSTSLNYAAVSSDGKMLAAFDPFDNYIAFWNTETGEMTGYYQPDLGDFSWVTQLAWSPDSSHLALLESKKITIYNTSDWQVVSALEDLDQIAWGDGAVPGFYRMAFSPSGEKLAVGSEGSLLLWNWEDDLVEDFVFLTSDGSEPVGSWDDPNSTNIGEILAIDWFSDGKRIIAAAHKGIAIWDIHDSTVRLVEVVNFTAYQ